MKRAALAFGLLGLIGGCASSAYYERAALDRAASTFGCPRASIGSTYLGGGGVAVSGCGQRQSYTCVRTGGGTVCQPDGPPTGTYVAPAESGDHRGDREEILAALAPCGLAPGSGIDVVIGAPGDVLRIDAVGEAQTCAEGALRHHAFASRPDAERVNVVVPSVTAPAEPTPSAPETSVRAMIIARRESILLCNGGAPTAVVGEWTPDGLVTLRLPDARAGSAEDGCVRATAPSERLSPAPGAAGSLLHPVQ